MHGSHGQQIHELREDRTCHHCGHIVAETRRVAIMVDGILRVSVPLCFPCAENALDTVMPLIERRTGERV